MARFHWRLGILPAILLSCAAGMTGCVDASEKISTRLTRYGLDNIQSRCVGERLEASLSLGQLQQLGRAAQAVDRNDASPGRLTVSDFLRVSSELPDVRVPLEVARAAAACGVLANPVAASVPPL